MLDTFTCAFFGHRDFVAHYRCEGRLKEIIKQLLTYKEYVEFLVGRNGEFDQFISSTIIRTQKECGDCNSALVLVLPYPTAEYRNNEKSFRHYYDEIEICAESSTAYCKSAIQMRNRKMVDRADLVICYIERNTGGAYRTIQYAKKQGKTIINLAR